jgi:hypothetical protein
MLTFKSNKPGFGCSPVLTVLVGMWLLTGAARAQAPDESTLAAARQLGQDGVGLYERGEYAAASAKFERAFAVVKVPTLGLWAGRALEKLGMLVEASQRYREVTLIALAPTDPQVLRTAQADAQTAYDALVQRIPQLTLDVSGAAPGEVSVTIDGKAVQSALLGAGLPVNVGAHKVEGRRGQQVVGETLSLSEGERRTYALSFEAVPTPAAVAASAVKAPPVSVAQPERDDSILPWVVVGSGAALAVTGVVFVALALSAKSSVESATMFSKAVQSDRDNVPTYSAVGFVLLGVGAAAVGAGLVWKYGLAHGGEGEMSVQAGATNVALRGTF